MKGDVEKNEQQQAEIDRLQLQNERLREMVTCRSKTIRKLKAEVELLRHQWNVVANRMLDSLMEEERAEMLELLEDSKRGWHWDAYTDSRVCYFCKQFIERDGHGDDCRYVATINRLKGGRER